jgi:hypothetical protein
MTGAKYLPDISFDFGGPDDEFDSEYIGFDGKDMIGDSSSDMKHGTFEDEDNEVTYELHFGDEEDEPSFNNISVLGFDEKLDDELIEPLQEQVNKTLEMFKKFKNY